MGWWLEFPLPNAGTNAATRERIESDWSAQGIFLMWLWIPMWTRRCTSDIYFIFLPALQFSKKILAPKPFKSIHRIDILQRLFFPSRITLFCTVHSKKNFSLHCVCVLKRWMPDEGCWKDACLCMIKITNLYNWLCSPHRFLDRRREYK